MSARVCICCGQTLSAKESDGSPNPNICPSCSSLVDGMEEAGVAEGEGSHAGPKAERAGAAPKGQGAKEQG